MKTAFEVSTLTVNELIRRYPRSIEVFNRHGIDACCGGAASVGDAAVRDGADADALLAELQRVIEAAG
jgi:regulator of cell morphogenesis and NO signaling